MLELLLPFIRRFKVGQMYNFKYHGTYRTVHVEELKEGKKGQKQIFGRQLIDGVFQYRTFNIAEIE